VCGLLDDRATNLGAGVQIMNQQGSREMGVDKYDNKGR